MRSDLSSLVNQWVKASGTRHHGRSLAPLGSLGEKTPTAEAIEVHGRWSERPINGPLNTQEPTMTILPDPAYLTARVLPLSDAWPPPPASTHRIYTAPKHPENVRGASQDRARLAGASHGLDDPMSDAEAAWWREAHRWGC